MLAVEVMSDFASTEARVSSAKAARLSVLFFKKYPRKNALELTYNICCFFADWRKVQPREQSATQNRQF